MSGPAIIILAAGSSSRMGQSKQLMVFKGETLLQRTVRIAKETYPENITVVLGANEEAHRQVIVDQKIEIVVNSNWPKGMGGSIKAGLKHLLKLRSPIDSAILMVCDQPNVSTAHLNKIISNHDSNPGEIIASHYADTVGVPALFPESYFEILLKLDDSSGAKKILQDHQDYLIKVELPGGEIDLDTMDDFMKLTK